MFSSNKNKDRIKIDIVIEWNLVVEWLYSVFVWRSCDETDVVKNCHFVGIIAFQNLGNEEKIVETAIYRDALGCPPAQDASHNQDHYVFSRGSLETFICHTKRCHFRL